MTNVHDPDETVETARSENADSTSSELERLNNASPCPSGNDSPTERGIAKSKKQEEHILRLIEEATALGTNTLDLSHKKMRQLPSEILEMPQIEYLYLEGNELSTLPDELFDKLPNLKWLDLRRNYLVRLPSVYIGRHPNLRNLLLEGNNLRTLPLELGLVKTLHGLNINNNPLDFPPHSIIEKGTNEVLKFLREMIEAKSSGKIQNGKKKRKSVLRQHSDPTGQPTQPDSRNAQQQQQQHSKSAGMPLRVRTGLRRSAHASIKAHSARLASQQFPLEEEPADYNPDIAPTNPETSLDVSSSSDDDWDDDGDLKEYAYKSAQERIMSTEAAKRANSGQIVPMNKTVQLHRPVSYTSLKQSKTEKIKKAGAMGIVAKPKKTGGILSKSLDMTIKIQGPESATSVLDWRVNPYPEPPPPEYASAKAKEERLLAKEREFKEKTDAILQRRKDEDMIKEWRNETKRLQQKKYFESLRKGTKDFLDPVQQAPFDIDQDYIKMPTNEERIKQDVKSAHEKIRRQVSPASRQRIEEEKAQRILQLEKRIKAHTAQMHERRKQPKGTPLEEMEAAKRELEVAEALHRELMASRKQLEYRFRAFVADVPTSIGRTRTLKPNK